ncbi:putative S-layer protein [Candidatus Woesearchaeota archaeon]|nr:putative S-layer protein [Candidatus Woesearchaeota archaeon]
MKKGNMGLNIVLLLIVAIVAASTALAVPVTIDKVKVEGDEIYSSSTTSIRALERDDELSIKVEVTATADVEDAQIEVVMRGYDHDDLIEDISDVFDMKANRTYVKSFTLKLPYRMDQDLYKLRVRVDDRDGDTTTETYELDINADRHSMIIKDIIFSPSNGVMAGRALLTTVRIANIGAVDEDDGIKVTVSIPELGISATDYIDEVEEEDRKTSEELYLRIPQCTIPGVYNAEITVEYDDGDEVEKETRKITVYEDETCVVPTKEPVSEPKTIITVGPTTQDLAQGEGGVIYPLTLSNAGTEAKTYVVSIDGYQDWADVKISPANIIVLQGGESKAVYLYVSAKEDAQVGEHMFSVDVTSNGKSLKQFTLKGNVVEPEEAPADGMDVKNVLLIGLLVLVILLVILGLIIGFGKLKGKDEESENNEEVGQTYY